MLHRTSALALLFSLAAVARAQPPVSIGVVLNFEHKPPNAFVLALEGELARIMGKGVSLHWVTDADSGATWDRAFIVKLTGSCSAGRSRAITPGARITLAQSIDQQGEILPFAELNCDTLRSFLQTTGEMRFGRATGRLLAHELWHVLLQTREHSKTGIAKAVQTPAALLSRSLRFDSEDLERFRSVALVRTQP